MDYLLYLFPQRSRSITGEKVETMQDLKDRGGRFEKNFHLDMAVEFAMVAMVTCRRSAQDYRSQNPIIDW